MFHFKTPASITDSLEFPDFQKETSILIDLQDVEFINSAGVRKLIQLLRKNSQRTITYQNCPKIFVDQLNMIEGLLGPEIKVKSFYAPYFCRSTEEEIQILLNADSVKNGKAPAVKHPDLDLYLEFDDIEEVYFSFLKY